MATKQDIEAAIVAGDLDQFRQCVQATPTLLGETFTSRGNTQEPILHFAVEQGKLNIVQELVQVHRKDPQEAGPDGGSALHAVKYCTQTSDPDTNVDPGNVLEWLLANGADITAVDNRGQTVVHVAIFAGREACLDALLDDPNFDAANIADGAGWSPMDVAGGSGHPGMENTLVTKGKAPATPLIPDDHAGGLTTVDILCMASKIIPDVGPNETFPQALQRAQDALRDHFKELYARPEFRSTLDIAAQAALGSRADDPPATRIYVDFTSDGAGSISGKGGYGAFDPDAKTLCLGAKRGAKAFEGTVVHELTHHAADVLYGNDAVPFDDETSQEAADYIDAIDADIKLRASLIGGPDLEVAGTVMDRIQSYSGRLPDPDRNRAAVLQEFIVGIPQAMHEYGENRTQDIAPNLLNLYKTQFEAACTQRIAADSGKFTQKVTQNGTYVATLAAPVDPPSTGPVWLTNGNGRPQVRGDMAQLVIEGYRAASDTVKDREGLKGTDPTARPIAHSTACFEIPEDPDVTGEGDSFYAFERKIREAVEPLMSELPPEVAMTRIGAFQQAAATACLNGIDNNTDALQHDMRDMIREAKFDYVAYRQAQGDDHAVLAGLAAEAILFDAACSKLEAAGGSITGVPEFSAKHRAAILAKLSGQISDAAPDKRTALFSTVANMKELSTMLENADGVLDASKLSQTNDKTLPIRVKSARKLWRNKLQTF